MPKKYASEEQQSSLYFPMLPQVVVIDNLWITAFSSFSFLSFLLYLVWLQKGMDGTVIGSSFSLLILGFIFVIVYS